jgi:L-arabinose isomerase
MIDNSKFEVWFVTGSQHLYGEVTLKKVAEHSQEMAQWLAQPGKLPVKVVFKPVLKTPDEITTLCREANNSQNCIGLITWMHTFSPAKMWIAGLSLLHKPFLHLHTQYNRDLPWSEIDMDFMNLNQSAHGDREFGFIGSRMRLERKVVVGFWQDEDVLASLSAWMRAACALHVVRTRGPLWRQHARSGGHRRRQGGRAIAAGLFCQWLWRGRAGQVRQLGHGCSDRQTLTGI